MRSRRAAGKANPCDERRPPLSLRRRDPGHRAAPLQGGARPADHLPARPHRSALVRRRTSRSPIPRGCSSRRTTTSSACSTARACRSKTSACRAVDGGPVETDPRKIWRTLRRALPSVPRHADAPLARSCFRDAVRYRRAAVGRQSPIGIIDRIADALRRPEFRPRALFERFNIEVIATTESAARSARQHRMIRDIRLERPRRHGLSARSASSTRSSTASRDNVARTRRDHGRGHGDMDGLSRRASQAPRFLQERWARPSTDHGHPTARPSISRPPKRQRLFDARSGGTVDRRRRRAVPRADADRDGAR